MSVTSALPWSWSAYALAAVIACVVPRRLARPLAVVVAFAVLGLWILGQLEISTVSAALDGADAAPTLRGALGPTYELNPLNALGASLTAMCTLTAVALCGPTTSRGQLVGALALASAIMSGWLAADIATLAVALLCAPWILAMSLTASAGGDAVGSDRTDASVASRALVTLTGASLALLAVGAYGLVELYNATRGSWSLALARLDALVLPAASEPVALAAVLGGSLVLMGAWPVHGWLRHVTLRGSPAMVALVVGPYRWLGLWLLLSLGSQLAGAVWFVAAPWVATVAVVGALVSAVASTRAPLDASSRARELLARGTGVPAGFALVGVLGGSVEGILGALITMAGHSLCASAWMMTARPGAGEGRGAFAAMWAGAPLFGVFTGAVLVVYGTVRFAGPALPGAAWQAAALVVAAAIYGVALARASAGEDVDAKVDAEVGVSAEADASAAGELSRPWRAALSVVVATHFVVLLALGAYPKLWLTPAGAAARARVDALYRARCVFLEQGPATRSRVLEARPEGCEAPVRRVIELAASAASEAAGGRAGGAGEPGSPPRAKGTAPSSLASAWEVTRERAGGAVRGARSGVRALGRRGRGLRRADKIPHHADVGRRGRRPARRAAPFPDPRRRRRGRAALGRAARGGSDERARRRGDRRAHGRRAGAAPTR